VQQSVDELDAVTDAVLLASRVLVAVAARSLASVSDDVTLPQYRALVVLATRGPQPLGGLAELLEVNPSTATRLCDRLVRKHLVTRHTPAANRREIEIRLTAAGQQIVDDVTRRRRREIARILRSVPARQRSGLVKALTAFGAAAGEVPEQAWTLGWST
jgi:DNA-binding MarR family transcriptional regulator